jgi:hypothetical protein
MLTAALDARANSVTAEATTVATMVSPKMPLAVEPAE